MKWYAYAETSTTYTMLLDHNITAKVAWGYMTTTGTVANFIDNQLVEDTLLWVSSLSPRLITANEVATITGNTSWNPSNFSTYYYYFDTLTTSKPSSYGKYGWLYDRTSSSCTQYGCLYNGDTQAQGYWTSTPGQFTNSSLTKEAYAIYPQAWIYTYQVDYQIGIRPVITVSKSIISQ